MQCMMKEVCAQCLQKHVDPVTGKESIIFSCFNQDQEMDRVDFPNLAAASGRTRYRKSCRPSGSITWYTGSHCTTFKGPQSHRDTEGGFGVGLPAGRRPRTESGPQHERDH